jgi:hypothetical protein
MRRIGVAQFFTATDSRTNRRAKSPPNKAASKPGDP